MAGYGAIEQMGSEAAPQRPARSAGRAKRAKSSTGPGEGSFLYEAGLGFDKENRCRTISLLSCLVFVTIGVTAWMQTCVPFCGAKTFKTGLWKDAWNNVTIPSDMLGSMDTTVDPCQDFYQFACGGFVESTGIKGDQVKWAEETRVCVCVLYMYACDTHDTFTAAARRTLEPTRLPLHPHTQRPHAPTPPLPNTRPNPTRTKHMICTHLT